MKSKNEETATSSSSDAKLNSNKKSRDKTESPKPNGVIEVHNTEDTTNDVFEMHEKEQRRSGATSKPNLQKFDSIQEDAQKIADLLELRNLEAIRARLRKVRKNPDRIEVVTNQLLEENDDGDVCEIVDVKEGKEDGCEVLSVVKPSDKASSHSNKKKETDNENDDSVMQAMLSDIREVFLTSFQNKCIYCTFILYPY